MKVHTARQNFGFTLLELLIVVALMAVIAGFTIPNFSTYINNQNLRQAQDQIVNDLRMIQGRALNGTSYSAASPATTYWAIKYRTSARNQYFYYVSTVTTVNAMRAECGTKVLGSSEKSQILPAGMNTKNTTDYCVYFSFANGDATTVTPAGATATPLYIGYPTSTGEECIGVRINGVGFIYKDDSVACP